MRNRLARIIEGFDWSWGLLFIHASFLFLNISRMEFFGEDEIGATLINSRVLMGLMTGNLFNLAAPLADSQPPLRNLVQVPFLAIAGVRELAVYLPHALASLGIFGLLLKLGQRCLGRSGAVWLALLYTASAAYAINRSPNAHGFFLLFLLGAFLASENYREAGSSAWLAAAWLLAALATVTFLEGGLFALYLLVASAPPGKRFPGMKEWRLALLAYGLPVSLYLLGFYLLPVLVIDRTIGNLTHLVQRQAGLQLSLANLPRFGLNYFYTFGPFLSGLLAGAVCIAVARWRRLPNMLLRLVAFFVPHLAAWLFLFDRECGHTLYAYPLFLTLAAWALSAGLERLKGAARGLVLAGVVLVLLGSGAYNTIHYGRVYPLKAITGLPRWQNYLPCGVNPAHQVGLKTAAYFIRTATGSQDLYLGNTGDSMSKYYLDRRSPGMGLVEMVNALAQFPAPDIYTKTSIRFVGLALPDERFNSWAEALDRAAPRWLEVRQKDGTLTLVIWDLSRLPAQALLPRQAAVDEASAAFDRTFSRPLQRFSSWLDYTPGSRE